MSFWAPRVAGYVAAGQHILFLFLFLWSAWTTEIRCCSATEALECGGSGLFVYSVCCWSVHVAASTVGSCMWWPLPSSTTFVCFFFFSSAPILRVLWCALVRSGAEAVLCCGLRSVNLVPNSPSRRRHPCRSSAAGDFYVWVWLFVVYTHNLIVSTGWARERESKGASDWGLLADCSVLDWSSPQLSQWVWELRWLSIAF